MAFAARPPSRAHRLRVLALLAGTAALYLWRLSDSGWANAYYAAAAQAGSQNLTAMFFGSSDAANAITVDKTPAALWVMDLSVRLFGVNSWAVLAPQAVEGVAAVALLYAAVRRVSGPGAGLLAGAILALTPAAALIFRFDNPDALLVLLLVKAGYCVLRAIEPGSAAWWLPLAGVALGFGFLAKMLQAFLVLPVFGAVYLLAAPAPLRTRLWRSAAAAAALMVSAGWYLAVVALWPADARPYIGGSQHNSILELTLGYNGVGRLTGAETGGLGNLNHDVGWARLFGPQMGGHIAWLLPAAAIATAAGLLLTRRAPRTDRVRAAVLLWGGWLAVTAAVFSAMNGIVHPYYTVALAPAVAASTATGAALLWARRAALPAATALAGMATLTVTLGVVLLHRTPAWLPWLPWLVAVVGLPAAALVFAGRTPVAVTRAIAAVAVVAALAPTAAYTVATAATPHRGAVPDVGPAHGRQADGGGPMGGLLGATTPPAAVTSLLAADADAYTWTAAVVGSNTAAGYQLATGTPVLAVGGFNGTDPAPTLERFIELVAQRRIHYYLGSPLVHMASRARGGSDAATRIDAWVAAHFSARDVDGVTVYDLTAPRFTAGA
ncbi:glycosyltransferase family 39 protein [Mycobacterium sp. MYCO198283]|uniref:glycosyltransferase family 39 protein n=1 Tax=Mycobacterium sp. MYCO198283 TaxID=2883505 RepID=UPI001E45091C|nr:glycosyltransferase family 39 protein [Mycobacterium sp. MYCO198283]MCG5432932.1 glycosyltransferase family 39 protein [Mycobacterium sp. MYCO198283]